MIFDNNFDAFFTNHSFQSEPSKPILISKEKYDDLKKRADNLEKLSEKIEKLTIENKQLKEELKTLKEKVQDYNKLKEENEKILSSLLRTQADFDNFKKISARENQKYKEYVIEKMLKKLINHYDDLLRALEVIKKLETSDSVKKGFEMVVKNFKKLLENERVKPMKCEGEEFNPYKHEVLYVHENDDLPDNIIIEELDKGYYFKDKTLRPAKVVISKSKIKNI
ncbi:MAG: nucleotide exchange factor GrpE [Promethearchaeota archaeon]